MGKATGISTSDSRPHSVREYVKSVGYNIPHNSYIVLKDLLSTHVASISSNFNQNSAFRMCILVTREILIMVLR
jgi:hypothetical protein